MTKLYLAHPHSERELGRKIKGILEDAGYDVINPFERAGNEVYIKAIADNRPFTDMECEEIVEGDLDAISQCDGVVAIWAGTGPTVGTPMECMYASEFLDLPVFSLYLWDNYGNGVIHPWINYLTTVVKSEEELVNKLAESYAE